MMDNLTKMMDSALKQGLIEREPKVGDWTLVKRLFIEDDLTLTGEEFKAVVIAHVEGHGEKWLSLINEDSVEIEIQRQNTVWLPSIEQLMDMVKHKDYWYVQHQMFDEFVVVMKPIYKKSFSSEREVRLAFAMHELHSMRWDGEKWIK